jgi:general secretion pathway protein D
MAEYSESLDTFREEKIELFTLLYPNVVEVASVIYGLYPDRTLVSLGEEEFEEDDEYDLSRRFRRFRVIDDNGNSQFMGMEAPQTTGSGSRTGSGTFSFSRGAAASRLTQWDQLRERTRRRGGADAPVLSADDAALVNRAGSRGDTNLVDSVRAQSEGASANIFVSVSRRNNMLTVRTSDAKVMDEIRSLVKRLDVPTPMVLMDVKVLELDVDDGLIAEFNYGFNRDGKAYDAADSSGRPAQNVLAGFKGFDPVANLGAMAGAMSFQVVSDKIAARIQLLQKDGKIRTLATPTLLTANNEVSRIFSGYEYPVVTGWRRSETIVTENSVVKSEATANVEIKNVGTMLLITPNINADKTVTLRLLQENSAVSPNRARIPVDGDSGETREVEYVESRSLAGTFVAKDDMMVLAGGLIKETEEEIYTKTPVLGSIPLIGWLFRGTEKVKKRTELIVLIKPHVILTPVEGGKVSSELLKALSAHPAADGRDSLGVHKPADGEKK